MAFIFLDHRQQHLEQVRAGINVVLAPVQYLVDLPFAVGHWAKVSLSTHQTLLDQNQDLKQKQLQLEVRQQKMAAIEAENKRLRALLQSSEKKWERVLIAELIAIDLDPFTHQIVLNKGSEDGVYEGHPILSAKGMMGQVVHVSPWQSTAMLITDPRHAIAVQNNRTGLRSIALGTGDNTLLDIPHISVNTDVQVGDLLVTSGLGQRFPASYPVAEVTMVDKQEGEAYARIEAKTTAALQQIREVLLVWPDVAGGEGEHGSD